MADNKNTEVLPASEPAAPVQTTAPVVVTEKRSWAMPLISALVVVAALVVGGIGGFAIATATHSGGRGGIEQGPFPGGPGPDQQGQDQQGQGQQGQQGQAPQGPQGGAGPNVQNGERPHPQDGVEPNGHDGERPEPPSDQPGDEEDGVDAG